MSELPKGWFKTQLGKLIEFKYGKSLPANLRDGNGFPVYGSNGVVGFHSIPLVKGGGLIIGRKGSFGEVHICEQDFSPIDTTYYVDEIPCGNKKYWFYQLFKLPLNKLNRSTAIPGLNRDDAYEQEILLPPEKEQTRIVEKLDEVLAQVDTIKARLDGIPAILKRFRQSVLAAAVSGRLTEEWRGKNEKASSQVVQLGSVISDITQGWSPKCENSSAPDGKWAVIKTSAVQKIEFLANENKLLPDELESRQDLVVNPGDIIVTRAGPRVRCGVTAYVENTRSKLMLCDKVYRFTVKADLGVSKFLALILNSPQYLEEIEEMKTGSSDSGMNLTQKKFKELSVNWPSVDEQKEIVRLVEQYFAFADTIEAQVKKAQTRVDNLTQSILAKAFRGELVAQDPADEPAEKLLERIVQARKEAEALAKAAKKVAKTK